MAGGPRNRHKVYSKEMAEFDSKHGGAPEPASVHELIQRYQRFRQEDYPARKAAFDALAEQQNPRVLFITCSDSRIAPDVLFQSEPGDLFVCRNVGNIVPSYGEALGGVSAAIEYAVVVLAVEAIIVCGHSSCGAMRALLDPEKFEHLRAVSPWLRHAEVALTVTRENYPGLTESELLTRLTEENVAAQIEHLETHPCVASRLRGGQLQIYGLVFEIPTGEIRVLDAGQGRFVPAQNPLPPATLRPRLFAKSST